MKLQDKLPESINARVECFLILILQNAVGLPSFGVVAAEDTDSVTDVVASVGYMAAD